MAEHADHDTGASRADYRDGLGESRPVTPGGLRHRLRENPATRQPYRIAVFLAGLVFVIAGFALAVLPGPLTIPPVLLGLWIWSTEFAWAQRFFDSFKAKAADAWAHAKKHPVTSAAITIGGLAAAGVAMWAVSHYDLVGKAKDAVGL